MKITSEDVEIFGWAMGSSAVIPAAPALESLLDMMDRQFNARMDGLAAGVEGHLRGENPHACSACKRQWDGGWVEGDARRTYMAERCGAPVVTLGLPL